MLSSVHLRTDKHGISPAKINPKMAVISVLISINMPSSFAQEQRLK